ncbi:MAG: hypothetical protein JOZ51_21880, partial [Chloroflexi bacterium]|nr:hypothetical protein [Chloroflexota bacterium]
ALLLDIAEFAEEWLTSAQALGLASRQIDTRIQPWERNRPALPVARARPVASASSRRREPEYEFEYEL